MIADLTPTELFVPQVELLEKLLMPIFHLRQDDGEDDLGDEIEEASEDAGEAIEEDGKPKKLKQNETMAMIAEILIGFGIVCELIPTFFTFIAWPSITGFGLSLVSLGMYIWGVLKWVAARKEPTADTAKRSWKTNIIMLWTVFSISIVYISISFAYILPLTLQVIGGFVGLAAHIAGLVLGYRIKNIWYHYDPSASEAEEIETAVEEADEDDEDIEEDFEDESFSVEF
jgi:hypothetical protein